MSDQQHATILRQRSEQSLRIKVTAKVTFKSLVHARLLRPASPCSIWWYRVSSCCCNSSSSCPCQTVQDLLHGTDGYHCNSSA